MGINGHFKQGRSFIFILLFLTTGCGVDNEASKLSPISEDLRNFYIRNISYDVDSQAEASESTTINNLFYHYKENDSSFLTIINNSSQYSIVGENTFHCYYVTKTLFDRVNNQNFPIPNGHGGINKTGLQKYSEGYTFGSWDEKLKNESIYELTIDTDIQNIRNRIGKYYLLDIVRFYKTNSNTETSIIDFVSYETSNNDVHINKNLSLDLIQYRYCDLNITFDYGFDRFIKSTYHYIYRSYLNHVSFLIEEVNGNTIICEQFVYDHRLLSNDPTYYKDIDECVLDKSFLQSTSDYYLIDGNQFEYAKDYYFIIFDYNCLCNLFGFGDI